MSNLLLNADTTTNNSHNNLNSNRIVLLFDLDCFYAQCERVRLGLEKDAKLALLQWNSVLAVTYPAREFGIKRGDSWEKVASKSNGECHAIHLHVLEEQQQDSNTTATTTTEEQQEEETAADDDADLKVAYEKIYNLTKQQQIEARQKEIGVRRFYHEGKACLERYRIASMRIFSVVLESLTNHLNRRSFVLERASIDEFYLDITSYCYNNQNNEDQQRKQKENLPKTVIVGQQQQQQQQPRNDDDHDSTITLQTALDRACRVADWIRNDVWTQLGFTMSAGISTNKMMAKLAAGYGKPNGQAMAHPNQFESIMQQTKIRKVRNFGGKLGKLVTTKFFNGNEDATMGQLAQIPLPVLRQHLSPSPSGGSSSEGGGETTTTTTAQYVFLACRGIDKEEVKATKGALVKSITAFKSFTATSNKMEIQKWLQIIVDEIVSRVQTDYARNKRYPKSCTLNYTHYTTTSGRRPNDGTHRTSRKTRALRLQYPNERQPAQQKVNYLKQQAMERLLPIMTEHPLRGIGLSASNFEARGQQPGVASIDSFFSAKTNTTTTDSSATSTSQASNKSQQQQHKKRHKPTKQQHGLSMYFSSSTPRQASKSSQAVVEDSQQENFRQDGDDGESSTIATATTTVAAPPPSSMMLQKDDEITTNSQKATTLGSSTSATSIQQQQQQQKQKYDDDDTFDSDMELAMKLQASYDREHYILSTADKNKRSNNGPAKKKKVRRIDAFFARR